MQPFGYRVTQRGLVKQRICDSVVFPAMAALPLSNAKAKPLRGVAIERPRTSDAIGSALRNAFDLEGGLPRDMACLLHRLDGASLS
jgi:hypothetical protein